MIVEVTNARQRPRHRRFQKAFASLCNEIGLPYKQEPLNGSKRWEMFLHSRLHGIRTINLNQHASFGLIHQALNRSSTPYIAEFDVPLAIHSYKIHAHHKKHLYARQMMEAPQFRGMIVFSEWARRSFELYYGPIVGKKCHVVYPLAYENAYCLDNFDREFDFTFMTINFRIKAGPEVVRAFLSVRSLLKSSAKLLVVTRLDQARKYFGDLGQYEGIIWQEANLSETEVADKLAQTKCMVMPSLSDSFGVVALEALAAGCALITSDIASFPEMVSTKNGILISPPTAAVIGDSFINEIGGSTDYHEKFLNMLSMHQFEKDIAHGMISMLKTPERTLSMMKASQELYLTKFSLDAWKANMSKVLRLAFGELF